MHVLPVISQVSSVSVEFFEEEYNTGVFQSRSLKSVNIIKSPRGFEERTNRNRKKRSLYGRPLFDPSAYERVLRIYRQKTSVTKSNCKKLSPSSLILPGDVGYGVDSQFKYQASTALRLAHFLSAFLQNMDDMDSFGHIKGGGRLHQEHLFGEVLANVMADFKILSSGIFYEPYTFRNPNETVRELFGPYAYRKNGGFYALDSAGLDRHYTLELWYREMKYRWNTNTEFLKTFNIRSMMRSDINGSSSVRHEHFPVTYRAPTIEQGLWMPPVFKCDDRVDTWVMTYVVPFFRGIKISRKVQFSYVLIKVHLYDLHSYFMSSHCYYINYFLQLIFFFKEG